ncbi:MAG: methyltransferase domain-containing protein [Elusimicrobia bacterium]|nr:methyltransferase domain-containing protein [Elusimicrobiota bacterium]
MGGSSHIPPAHFSSLTPLYDLFCALIGLGKPFRREILRHLAAEPDERVIDAGCGTGELLRLLESSSVSIKAVGADPDGKALALARRKLESVGRDVEWVQASMSRLPFPEASFDAAVSTLAFHHIPAEDRLASLREVLRVLKPGGRFVLCDLVPDAPSAAARLAFRLLSLLEPLQDNARLAGMLAEAGFSEVSLIGRYRGIIGYFQGRKRN